MIYSDIRPVIYAAARGIINGDAVASSGYTFVNAEAATLVAAMSVAPDDTRKGVIDTLVGSLKSAGVWAKLDCLWISAAHDAQAARLNWKAPGTDDLTAVNSPTFVVDRGYTGDGATSYLNTGFVPSTDGVTFTLNSACISVWSRTSGITTLRTEIGVISTHGLFVKVNETDAKSSVRVNTQTSDIPTTSGDGTGLYSINRSSSSACQSYRNGVAGSTFSRAVTGLPTAAVFIGAFNNAGTPSQFSLRQIAAAALGGSRSSTEETNFYNSLQTYMTAVGA